MMSVPTCEQTLEMLRETLQLLGEPEYVRKLEEAKEANGNEMLKLMQYVFPVVMQVQMEVMKRHGFGEGRDGLVRLAQLLRAYEREDAEVARLHNLIRAHYLPPVSVSASAEAAHDPDKTSSS